MHLQPQIHRVLCRWQVCNFCVGDILFVRSHFPQTHLLLTITDGMWEGNIYMYTYLGQVYVVKGTDFVSRETSGWKSRFSIHCNNFYLFIFRERGREGEREGEKHWCVRDTSIGCLSNAPSWGPGPQPRHVSSLGIKTVPFWFTGQHSIHWATPARALVTINTTV